METYYIYTLENPTTNEIRYVGYTKKSLPQRLNMHLKNVNEAIGGKRQWNKRLSWIKSLLAADILPVINELDVCYSKQNAYELEIYWIEQMKQWGFSLVNMTLGGDGGDTFSQQSAEVQKSISDKISLKLSGRPRSIDTIDKWRDSLEEHGHWLSKPGAVHPMKNKTHSKKSKAQMSKAKLGRSLTEEHKNHMKGHIPFNDGISKYPKVIQFNAKNEIVNTFNTPGDAIKSLNLSTSRQSEIVRCCKGKTKKAFGYCWKFEN
jgi:hypothetical protein